MITQPQKIVIQIQQFQHNCTLTIYKEKIKFKSDSCSVTICYVIISLVTVLPICLTHQGVKTFSTQEVDHTSLHRLRLGHLLVDLLLLEGGGTSHVHVQQVPDQWVCPRDHRGLRGSWSTSWWCLHCAGRFGAQTVTEEESTYGLNDWNLMLVNLQVVSGNANAGTSPRLNFFLAWKYLKHKCQNTNSSLNNITITEISKRKKTMQNFKHVRNYPNKISQCLKLPKVNEH